MDVYGYLPDVISYSSMRHPYSNPNQDNAWSMETPKDKRMKNSHEKNKGRGTSCHDCPICQERQRRPLASYIRQKSRQNRCGPANSISEDSEDILEEEEEEEEVKESKVEPVKKKDVKNGPVKK